MKQIAVASGKGGTGKTSLVASFARIAGALVTADADVDAANLALLMPGEDERERPFRAGRRMRLDHDACLACLACVELCRFDALRAVRGLPRVDGVACTGCGACSLACPAGAISFGEETAGAWTIRATPFGPLVHARLAAGRDNSGKLVARVREEARRAATRGGLDLILIDGPPGLGCPVHATLTGVDLALVVTEPTAAGLHDLQRILALASHFQVSAAVIINKADLHREGEAELSAYCRSRSVEVLGRIPFDPAVPRALAAGGTPLEVPAIAAALCGVWSAVVGLLDVGERQVGPRLLPLAATGDPPG